MPTTKQMSNYLPILNVIKNEHRAVKGRAVVFSLGAKGQHPTQSTVWGLMPFSAKIKSPPASMPP